MKRGSKKQNLLQPITQREFVSRVRGGCPVCGGGLHVRMTWSESDEGGLELNGGRYISCDGYAIYRTCPYYISGVKGAWKEVSLKS